MIDVPISTNFDFLGPNLGVPPVGEIVLKYRAVLVAGNALQTIPDQETCDGKSYQDTKARNDVDPFLSGVLLLQPRLLDLALLYPPGMEISLLRHMKGSR